MKKLKIREGMVKKVDLRNLAEVIQETYLLSRPPSLAKMEGYPLSGSWGGFDCVTIKREPLPPNGRRLLNQFFTYGFAPHALIEIMTDMCNKGILEPGTYLIDLAW